MEALTNYEGSGIYLTWNRITSLATGTVDHYRILRSSHRDGDYTSVDTVDVPENEYVDLTGAITDYYTIQEEASDDTVIATHPPMWGEESLLRASLGYEMQPFMRVPVYDEELIFINDERTIARAASWGSWNYLPRPELSISYMSTDGDRAPAKLLDQGTVYTDLETSDGDAYDEIKWVSDYNGYVYFTDSNDAPVSIKWHDNILISYQFQAISPSEMNDALYLAACGIVAQAGVNKDGLVTSPRNLGNLPRRWDMALVFGAAYFLIRRIALMLVQRERRLVFLDPNRENESNPFSNINTLMQQYKEQFEEAKKAIQTEKFPSVGVVLTQEFMLPGQRNRFFRMSFKGY